MVIASGYGTVAEHIIDIAEKKGDSGVRGTTARHPCCGMLEVGSNIPVELYEVVAAIYCKLIETSAQIRGVEKSRSESASARSGNKEREPATDSGRNLRLWEET